MVKFLMASPLCPPREDGLSPPAPNTRSQTEEGQAVAREGGGQLSRAHGQQRGLSGPHTPFTSAWPSQAAKPEGTTQAPVIGPHGSQFSSRPAAAAWTRAINMASGGVKDHGGPLRGSNPESEHFLISGVCLCPVFSDRKTLTMNAPGKLSELCFFPLFLATLPKYFPLCHPRNTRGEK